MYAATCRRCLARPSVDYLTSLVSRTHLTPLRQTVSSFSTSAVLADAAAKKGPPRTQKKGPPKKGEKSFKKKKNRKVASSGPKPAPGERRKLRRRIVLSNPTALDVALEEATEEKLRDAAQVGNVLALNNGLIDKLRSTSAFRKTQAWQYFKQPAMLVRKETVELANEMKSINGKHISRIYVGERGSGKSLMLLQAQTIAFQQGWIVMSIPEAMYVTDGSTDYRPVPQSRPLIYDQRGQTIMIIRRLMGANPSLANHKLAFSHDLPSPVKSDGTIADLASQGLRDSENIVLFFEALIKELTAPGRPPILLTLDGIAHVMKDTAYRSPQFKPIHAHDLTFVRWFMSHLSGQRPFSNGGMVLAATSGSNEPKIQALQFRLHQLEVKQALEKGLPNPRQDAELPDPVLPFLLATGQQPNPVPQPDAHYSYDQRVFEVLGSPYGVVAGNKTADSREVQVQKLKGVSKDEARGMMEYWAKSGIMRQTINDRIVGEKWSLSGGGIPSELERACVRFRI